MSDLPPTSRELRLAARPEGLPGLDHFALAEVPMPQPGPGQVLVRNLYFRVSASLRMMISEGAAEITGVPFSALAPGDTLAEGAMGEVVSAPADSGLQPGDLVSHMLGWREYALLDPGAYTRANAALPGETADLGHGWTAYDAAVVRGAEDSLAAQLAAAAPDGIDVFLDNVGGEQLRAAVEAAREGARFVLLGALSGQLAETGTGRVAPVELDSFQLLLKKITIRGYSADDDPEVQEEWAERFGAWLRAGDIIFPHVRIKGIKNAPRALIELIEGRHLGAVFVEL